VGGGPDAVIDALLETIDPAIGTLLVPTLTGSGKDGPEYPPRFDTKTSRCWTGLIPETLRLRQEAYRSLSPTHSVAAIGKHACELTTGHEDCWTPCGYGSPYYRLCRRGGHILLLGVTLESNTTFHTVEEVVGVSYHLQPLPTACTMKDADGNEMERKVMLHDWGTRRRFSVLEPALLAEGIMKSGRIGHAHSWLIDAARLLSFASDQLRNDPRLFVSPT
jgi:aminoglycoside 3-N-acetyltransferase